jgi:Xaa-Pro aminopeptidase
LRFPVRIGFIEGNSQGAVMLQTFTVSAQPDQGPPRLARLRAALAERGLDGFLVPRADAHQGEYVAPCDARLEWLTGFTGTAGLCAVLADRAGLFVDGRYREQARSQVDTDHFSPVDMPATEPGDWLAAEAGTGAVIGFDPWLHTEDAINRMRQRTDPAGLTLQPVAGNPIDAIWDDRPARPSGAITAYPAHLAGRDSAEKRALCAETLQAAAEAAAVLTLPDSLCWLLNIRGADIPRIPIVQAFAILHADAGVELFVAPERAAAAGLDPQVRLFPPSAFLDRLDALSGRIRVDPKTAPLAVIDRLPADRVVRGDDPCLLPKACKTPAELAGAAAAHRRDGAAMTGFLAWLAAQPVGEPTEIDVVVALEGFRRATGQLKDIAFETIAGAGPHGAIVHYRVTEATNRPLGAGELLLLDSGGQYLDGTTDITRTIAIGPTDPRHRATFTRVLKGMIALSRLRFPRGLAGRDIDAIARAPLWAAGQDYDHGTGHGVGHYLSVHEGPQQLSRRSAVALAPGMILSNEPGHYTPGGFGIRIENLMAVVAAPALPGGDDREMLAFDTLTLCPIDLRLVEVGLLDTGERDWLNGYHARVRAEIGPLVTGDARGWLKQATAPI